MRLIKLDPNDIVVDKRMRKELGNISELADSIKKHGQITPILVVESDDGRYRLIAGERRLQACKSLGIQVEAKVVSGDAVKDEEALELLENVSRKDFTPIEKAIAIKNLHDRLLKENPKWTATDTAKYLGVSRTTVTDALAIVVTFGTDQTKLQEAKSLTQNQLRQLARQKRKLETETKKIIKKVQADNCRIEIHKADFFTTTILPDNHFHFIATDPPWGINYEEVAMVGKNKITEASYDDKLESQLDKWELMWKRFYKLLREDGRLVTFVAVLHFKLWVELAKKAGFQRIYSIPLIWYKGAFGPNPCPQYYPSSCYDCLLLAYKNKGSTLVTQGRGNVLEIPRVPSSKQRHPAEKPIALWEELLERFAIPGTPFLDPFCGSGSSLKAAFSYKMSEVWGLDINKACIQLTKNLLGGSI